MNKDFDASWTLGQTRKKAPRGRAVVGIFPRAMIDPQRIAFDRKTAARMRIGKAKSARLTYDADRRIICIQPSSCREKVRGVKVVQHPKSCTIKAKRFISAHKLADRRRHYYCWFDEEAYLIVIDLGHPTSPGTPPKYMRIP